MLTNYHRNILFLIGFLLITGCYKRPYSAENDILKNYLEDMKIDSYLEKNVCYVFMSGQACKKCQLAMLRMIEKDSNLNSIVFLSASSNINIRDFDISNYYLDTTNLLDAFPLHYYNISVVYTHLGQIDSLDKVNSSNIEEFSFWREWDE